MASSYHAGTRSAEARIAQYVFYGNPAAGSVRRTQRWDLLHQLVEQARKEGVPCVPLIEASQPSESCSRVVGRMTRGQWATSLS